LMETGEEKRALGASDPEACRSTRQRRWQQSWLAVSRGRPAVAKDPEWGTRRARASSLTLKWSIERKSPTLVGLPGHQGQCKYKRWVANLLCGLGRVFSPSGNASRPRIYSSQKV